MKTFFKILAVIFTVLVLAAFILPYVFKGKIIELAKTEINNQLNARIDFSEMDFGLVRSFPDFRLTVTNFSIVGKEPAFQNDTLVLIPEIKVVFSLIDVLKGDYVVKKINLNAPRFNVHVLPDGRANYDIVAESGTPTDVEVTAPADQSEGLKIALRQFSIVNGNLTYRDETMNLLVQASGFNHNLSGDLTADRTVLYTQTAIDDLLVSMDQVNFLNHVALNYQANLDADLANSIYTFRKNELMVNQLKLNFEGSVSMLNDGINLVLTYKTPSTHFKDLLSLVPEVFLKEIQGFETTGTFSLNGMVKGVYAEEKYPAFSLNLQVNDATAKYPDLPGAISGIKIKAAVENPGGELDNTVIDVSQFHLDLGKNPLDVRLKLSTPISDPDIAAEIKARMDLATLKNYYPIDSAERLSGVVVADINLKGKLSAIEQEKYEEFLAMGSVVLQNMEYNTPELKNPVVISMAQLNFSPRYIDLVSFDLKTGGSDLKANGKLTNYLAWYLKNETLDGTLAVSSNYFNMDDLMDSSDQTDTTAVTTPVENPPAATVESDSAPTVPSNINFVLGCNMKQLVYDNLDMTNVSGKLMLKNGQVNLNNLRMMVAGGSMQVDGSYATPKLPNAEASLVLKLNNLDIPTAYQQFAFFRQYLPLAGKATGKFNASLDFNTGLNPDLLPVYQTLNGKGWISSNQVRVQNLNTLEEAARLLNYKEFSNLTLEKVLVEFKFVDGKLIVDPFDLKYKGIKGTLSGWTALDSQIGYTMKVEVPRKELGTDVNKLLDNLVGEVNKLGANFSVAETIPFELSITGTLDNPVVSAKPGSGKGKDTTKEIINKELENQKEALGAEAKKIIEEADRQAKQLMTEAENQARELRKNAVAAKERLLAEAKKQGNQLVAEGKKNGVLGEMAAKKAATALEQEAENQGNNLISEAGKQADNLINTAKISSEKLKTEAQRKADALTK